MEEVHKLALRIENRFRNSVDNKNHPSARQLQSEIQRLVDEVEMKRNPKQIEQRVFQLERVIKTAENDRSLSADGADELRDGAREMINSLRKLM
jgi:hypothetical protein